MTEADLSNTVIEMARLFGWRIHHCRPARTSSGWRTAITGHAGFPDLVLARQPGGVHFIELKSDRGTTTDDQTTWHQTISAAVPGRMHVWRPAELLDGTIERFLR